MRCITSIYLYLWDVSLPHCHPNPRIINSNISTRRAAELRRRARAALIWWYGGVGEEHPVSAYVGRWGAISCYYHCLSPPPDSHCRLSIIADSLLTSIKRANSIESLKSCTVSYIELDIASIFSGFTITVHSCYIVSPPSPIMSPT